MIRFCILLVVLWFINLTVSADDSTNKLWIEFKDQYYSGNYTDAESVLKKILDLPIGDREDSLYYSRSVVAYYAVLLRTNKLQQLASYIDESWSIAKRYAIGQDSLSQVTLGKGYYSIFLLHARTTETNEQIHNALFFLDSAATQYQKAEAFQKYRKVKRITFQYKARVQDVATTKSDWKHYRQYFDKKVHSKTIEDAIIGSMQYIQDHKAIIALCDTLIAKNHMSYVVDSTRQLQLYFYLSHAYIHLDSYIEAGKSIEAAIRYFAVQKQDFQYHQALNLITCYDSIIQANYPEAQIQPLAASIVEPALLSGVWNAEVREQTAALVGAQIIRLESHILKEMLGDKYLTIFIIVVVFAVLLLWLAYANYTKEVELRRIAQAAQDIYDEMRRDDPFGGGGSGTRGF